MSEDRKQDSTPHVLNMQIGVFSPGEKLGKFEILRIIGEGGLGVVYAAKHLITGEEVALKVLKSSSKGDEREAGLFIRELKVGRELTHPNIVRIHDIDCHEGIYYFSMELLEGHDLGEDLGKNPGPSLERIGEIMIPVLDALEVLHNKSIIHRDLKPQNIFLTTSGTVKLLDFGLARLEKVPTFTHTGEICGSPRYMSPEQIKGGRDLDGRVDIYSFGMILYEMLTGQTPFKQTQLYELLRWQINANEKLVSVKELRSDILPGLDSVVMKCIEKDREKRFRDVKALRVALKAALKESTDRHLSDSFYLSKTKTLRKEKLKESSKVPSEFVHHEKTSLTKLWKRNALTILGISAVIIVALIFAFLSRPGGEAYAMAYERLRGGDRNEAQIIFEKLAKRIRTLDKARGEEGIAAVLMDEKKLPDAKATAKQAIEMEPDLVYAHVILGDLLRSSASAQDAVNAYNRAVDGKVGLDWQRAVARSRLAQIAMAKENYNEAEGQLNEAVNLSKDLPEAHKVWVNIALKQGDDAKAKGHLAKLLEINPKDTTAAILMSELNERQSLLADEGRKKRIQSLAQELVKRFNEGKDNQEGMDAQDDWTSKPKVLWVMELEEKGISVGYYPGLAQALNASLRKEIASIPAVRMVERDLIEEILSELSLGSSELARKDNALKLGKLTGARIMIAGSVDCYAEKISVNMRAVEVETSEVMLNFSVDVDPEGDPSEASKAIAVKLTQKLDEIIPLRGKVSEVQESGVLINIGKSAGVAEGMRFAVFKPGGNQKTEVGSIKVVKVSQDSSLAQSETEGGLQPEKGFLVEALKNEKES